MALEHEYVSDCAKRVASTTVTSVSCMVCTRYVCEYVSVRVLLLVATDVCSGAKLPQHLVSQASPALTDDNFFPQSSQGPVKSFEKERRQENRVTEKQNKDPRVLPGKRTQARKTSRAKLPQHSVFNFFLRSPPFFFSSLFSLVFPLFFLALISPCTLSEPLTYLLELLNSSHEVR